MAATMLLPAGVLVSMFGVLCYMMASVFQKWSPGSSGTDFSQHDRAWHTSGLCFFLIGWALLIAHFAKAS